MMIACNKLDAETFLVYFGTSYKLHDEQDIKDRIQTRTHAAIAMGAKQNIQDSCKLFHLNKAKKSPEGISHSFQSQCQ